MTRPLPRLLPYPVRQPRTSAALLVALSEMGRATIGQLAARFGATRQYVGRELALLVRDGAVRRSGVGVGRHAPFWFEVVRD
jgi:predicted ArsR family transcriptional regulator